MIDHSSFMSVTEARELAVRAHGDQRDRDGSFHIAHVARVAEKVPREAPYQRVAWLHDVVEDSQLTVQQLRLPDVERAAIALLTRDEREPYQDYVRRLAAAAGQAGELARSIKEADLLDNLHRCAAGRDRAIGQYGRALATIWSPARCREGASRAAGPARSRVPGSVPELTVKGVCIDDDHRVVLCLNDRGEWELPGGRPKPGESYPDCLTREVLEETGLQATVGSLILAYPYEVLPDRWVHVVVYGCELHDAIAAQPSSEHRAVQLFSAGELERLAIADGYRHAISSAGLINRSALAEGWLRAGG